MTLAATARRSSGMRRSADTCAPGWTLCTSIFMAFRVMTPNYILSTFPIVQKEDEAEFGTYRTRNLILAYMSAFAAGDTETRVAG